MQPRAATIPPQPTTRGYDIFIHLFTEKEEEEEVLLHVMKGTNQQWFHGRESSLVHHLLCITRASLYLFAIFGGFSKEFTSLSSGII